jgi:hypothetical protein
VEPPLPPEPVVPPPLFPPEEPEPVEPPLDPEVEVEPPEEEVNPLPQARVKMRTVISKETDKAKWQRRFTGGSAGNGVVLSGCQQHTYLLLNQ